MLTKASREQSAFEVDSNFNFELMEHRTQPSVQGLSRIYEQVVNATHIYMYIYMFSYLYIKGNRNQGYTLSGRGDRSPPWGLPALVMGLWVPPRASGLPRAPAERLNDLPGTPKGPPRTSQGPPRTPQDPLGTPETYPRNSKCSKHNKIQCFFNIFIGPQ